MVLSVHSGLFMSRQILKNEIYANMVQLANKMMKEDIESILSIDKDAIIAISGDHGAHRKGECQVSLKNMKIMKLERNIF